MLKNHQENHLTKKLKHIVLIRDNQQSANSKIGEGVVVHQP
jgi:hypothetical protein